MYNDFILYGKGGEFTSNRIEDQEIQMLCLHLLQVSLVYILSRDFVGFGENPFHSAPAASATASIAAATSVANSSARRKAWRIRATSNSRAAICPAGSPRVCAALRSRSWLASIRRKIGAALFLGCAWTQPKHTKPFGQCSPVGKAQICVPISRKLQLAEKAAHSSAVGLRLLSSPCTARYTPCKVLRYSSTSCVG